MMRVILFFVVAGIAISAVFGILMNRLRRRKATYSLFAVRDKFVLLAAKGELNEESHLFKYYYKRINMLLQAAPNIGLDDALKSFILKQSKTPKDLASTMEKAMQEATKVLQSKELENDEIANAVKLYYSTNKEMILSHSSITRLLYYAISHGLVKNSFMKKVPVKFQKALAVIKMSGEELKSLSNNTHCTF
jgi:hypothetical protein